MSDPAETRVLDFLERQSIPYERMPIDPEFADTAEFCARYGVAPGISGNTILVASRKTPRSYAVCVVTADMRLDVNHRARELVAAGKLSFATAEETQALTGMRIGGVTPFALPDGLPIFVEEAISRLPEIVLGSGGRSFKLRLAPEALRRVPGLRFVAGLGSARPQPMPGSSAG